MFPKPPVILLLATLCAMRASAQELEPRAYSASPIGTNFVLVGVGRSSGDVVFDPTVPITDVHADINAATLGGGRTFSLGGHLVLATVALPYVWGEITGKVFEAAASTTRSGLGDARMKVSVTLHGTPALTPAAFAKASEGWMSRSRVRLSAEASTPGSLSQRLSTFPRRAASSPAVQAVRAHSVIITTNLIFAEWACVSEGSRRSFP